MWKRMSYRPVFFSCPLVFILLLYGLPVLAQDGVIQNLKVDTDLHQDATVNNRFHILATGLNSIYSEYPTALLEDGLIFISNRPLDHPIKRVNADLKVGFDRWYISTIGEDGGLLQPKLFSPFEPTISSKILHYGPVYIFTDGQKMIVTLSVREKSGQQAFPRLFMADKKGSNWIITDTLFKDHKGSFSQPFVDEDTNRLYFVSDIAGGYGGTDIYFSYLGSEKFENAGPMINTSGNEIFPNVGKDGFLYFSSNGHAGMGGFDFFRSAMGDGFGKPLNLGNEINSTKNETAVVFDRFGKRGFFSSDRNKENALGIYQFYMVPESK
jgi:hypothetical protein